MSASSSPPSREPAGPARIDWAAALVEHDRWLRTVVLARLGERQAVDEVMQEVSLAAVEQHAPLADATKVAAWLYRVAVTQSVLYRRRHGRRQRLLGRYAERVRQEDGNGRTADPLAWLLVEERCRLVRDVLDRLPRRDAEILLLKYTENWSYRELAARLGVSESAVEARLHRARERLRNGLADRKIVEVQR